MRRLLLSSLSILLVIGLDAQGVYTCYDFDAPRVGEPVPEGFSVFYISHYGRHGARYIYGENDYTVLNDVFSGAALTPLGEQVRKRFDSLYPLLKCHAGELSPVGEEQQRMLGHRMKEDFPEVFTRCCRVEAVSSDVSRCVRSMECFLEGLKEGGKKKNVSGRVEISLLPVLKNGPIVHDNTDSLFLSRFNVDAVYDRLFKEPSSAKQLADPLFFVRSLYYFCAHLPSAGLPREPVMEQAFSHQEWDLLNFLEDEKFSLHGGWSRPANVARIWPLLENFVIEADDAIASGRKQVRLRFGHDNALIPLMALQEMGPFNTTDIFNCADCPMAANVRWIFARGRNGRVIVKVQYNESDVCPWTPWEEFRKECRDKIVWAKMELEK